MGCHITSSWVGAEVDLSCPWGSRSDDESAHRASARFRNRAWRVRKRIHGVYLDRTEYVLVNRHIISGRTDECDYGFVGNSYIFR